MSRLILAAALIGLAAPATALACGGSKSSTAKADVSAEQQQANAENCAKKASLVGTACPYTTGAMASRIVAEGATWSYSGGLTSTSNALTSKVAAPYAVGPNAEVHLVANEVLEELTNSGLHAGRVSLEGKMLTVDGLTYVVVTGYRALNA